MRVSNCIVLAVTATLMHSGCSCNSGVQEISVGSRTLAPIDPPRFGDNDWPWWRGPNRDGKAVGDSYPTRWSETENVLWKVEIPGRGHASPTVVGNRIFVVTAEKGRQVQSVLCFDRETGRRLWRKDVHQGNLGDVGHLDSTYASSTVASDGKRVFAVFRNDGAIHVTALDLDGKQLWQKEVGPHSSDHGYGASPVIYKSLVIVAADSRKGGFIAALHRKTGEIWWRKPRHSADSYSSPVIAHVAGKDQLLLSGGKRIVSYNPANGEEFWSVKGCADVTCGTMVWNNDTVFASGGYSGDDDGNETIAVRADGSHKIVWQDDDYDFYVPSMISIDGYVYGIHRSGVLYCVNAGTGDVVQRKRLGGNYYAAPILAAGHVYVTSRGGKITVFKPNPQGVEIVAVNRLGDEMDATPVACGGRIYLRVAYRISGKRQEMLYCIGTK